MWLFDFLKKVVKGLFSKDNVKDALNVDINISNKMANAIKLWTKMYEGKPDWVKKDVYSLSLPCSIAAELARLTTIEMKSEIVGSDRAEFMNEPYQNLMDNIRIHLEYALAKGSMAFKPFISDGKIAIDCVQADMIYPIEFNSFGELISCIFVDRFTKNEKTYTRLEYHSFENGKCTIINKAYMNEYGSDILGSEIKLDTVSRWKDIEREITIDNLTKPLFSYFKVPMANTIESNSDIGVSVFSKAVDLIKKADEQYSRIVWEYKGSELAVDIDENCYKNNNELPEYSDRLFRKLDIQGRTNDFYSVFSPAIRDSSLFNGLNKLLQRIEFACGLAYGTLSDVQETAKTATEIISSKQRSYATVSDIQKSLKSTLENLIISMDDLCSLYNLVGQEEYEVSFEFDDSLIVDSGADQAIMLQEVAAGIIKPEIYLMRRYGLTEEQCKDYMPSEKIEKEPDDVDEE